MKKSKLTTLHYLSIAFISSLLISGNSFSKTRKYRRDENKRRLVNKRSLKKQTLLKRKSKKSLKKKIETYESLSKNIFKVSSPGSQFLSWGVSHVDKNSTINLLEAWKNFNKKKNIVVAVIDTGIDPSHPFLKKNIIVTKGKQSVTNYGIDFSKNRKYIYKPKDTHGHGTHVAGIIKSVFPSVGILTLKYYNQTASGQANLSSTIEALRYAVDNNVDIINYSGGGPEPALEELSILKKAEAKGILIVAAAGNEESNIDLKNNAYYPASYGLKNIITVASHNRFHKILSSSNYGKKSVDISAPGHRIKSSLPGSRSGFLTGTSQATAFVTGVAALIKSQFPNLKAADLKSIITRSAKKDIRFMNKIASGGELNAGRALKLAIKENSKSKVKKSRSIAFLTKNKTTKGKIIYRNLRVNNSRSAATQKND